MKISLIEKLPKPDKQNFYVYPVFEGEKPDVNNETIEEFFKDHPKFGKAYEHQLLYTASGKILLIGLGKADKLNYEIIQNYGGVAAKQLSIKTFGFILNLPQTDKLPQEILVEAISLGMELAVHDPASKYKSDQEPVKLERVGVVVSSVGQKNKEALKKAEILAEAINLVKSLGDMPGNEMIPAYFVKEAKKVALENKLKIRIINETQAKKLGMGAFTAVAQGSDEPSFMISLEYRGNPKSKEKWGLIGKGITFDSGGISIKPGDKMTDMKYDMSGAATALATILAVSRMGLKVNLAVVCAVTENLPSGKAFKPGDILKSYSGKTVEVLNTDAEGRLILIDAISLALKDLKATKIIDLATLTGAMIVALGDNYTGVFTNNPGFAQELINQGKEVGEKFWEMPMGEEFAEMIKSDFADMANLGHGGSMPGAAGSITAAKFLEQVVDKNIPWLHLDIAGTAWDLKAKPYRNIGATGVCVKSLIKLLSC